jgi:hypothetical protein
MEVVPGAAEVLIIFEAARVVCAVSHDSDLGCGHRDLVLVDHELPDDALRPSSAGAVVDGADDVLGLDLVDCAKDEENVCLATGVRVLLLDVEEIT